MQIQETLAEKIKEYSIRKTFYLSCCLFNILLSSCSMTNKNEITNLEAGVAPNRLASRQYLGEEKFYSSQQTERLRFLFKDFSSSGDDENKELRIKHGSIYGIKIDMGTIEPKGSLVFNFYLSNNNPVWGRFASTSKKNAFIEEFALTNGE